MDKKHSETLVLHPKNAKNFLIRKLTPSPILDSAVVFDSKIKCKGCHHEYPNNSIKRHLFTYYKCHQYYEQNENHKMELDQILKLRNLDALNKLPKPNHCFCIKNFGKCYTCEL